MARLKTKEDLEKMFNESKARHALKKGETRKYTKREKDTSPSQTLLLALDLAKKIQEARKRKEKQLEVQGGVRKETVDNMSSKSLCTPHKQSRYLGIRSNPFLERARNECDLYLTREELQEAERDPNESGRINWEKWDELISKSRTKLEEG